MLGSSPLRLNLRVLQGVPLSEASGFLKIASYSWESFKLFMSIEESFSISGVIVNQ